MHAFLLMWLSFDQQLAHPSVWSPFHEFLDEFIGLLTSTQNPLPAGCNLFVTLNWMTFVTRDFILSHECVSGRFEGFLVVASMCLETAYSSGLLV